MILAALSHLLSPEQALAHFIKLQVSVLFDARVTAPSERY
jgi:hypothetical protein